VPIENMAPFRKLKGYDLNVKGDRTQLSKARFVIERCMMRFVNNMNASVINSISVTQFNTVFEEAYLALFQEIRPDGTVEELDARRVGDLSYTTLYELVKNKSRSDNGQENV
jgi:hypothetical protein